MLQLACVGQLVSVKLEQTAILKGLNNIAAPPRSPICSCTPTTSHCKHPCAPLPSPFLWLMSVMINTPAQQGLSVSHILGGRSTHQAIKAILHTYVEKKIGSRLWLHQQLSQSSLIQLEDNSGYNLCTHCPLHRALLASQCLLCVFGMCSSDSEHMAVLMLK